MSLLIGVEVICLITLLTCISIISSVSSKAPLEIQNIFISTNMQMAAGSWAFIGIPITIAAGVAALYRVEIPLRVLFVYLVISFFFGVGIPLWLLGAGSLCDSVVTPEVQRMGSSFVCGFTDTFIFFWTLIGGCIHAYLIYIVWSAAEEICEAPFPELMKYSDALKNVYMPDAPADFQYPMGAPRAAGLQSGAMDPGMLGRSFGTFQGAPGTGALGPGDTMPSGKMQGMGGPPQMGMNPMMSQGMGGPPQMGMNPMMSQGMGGPPQSFMGAPGGSFR